MLPSACSFPSEGLVGLFCNAADEIFPLLIRYIMLFGCSEGGTDDVLFHDVFGQVRAHRMPRSCGKVVHFLRFGFRKQKQGGQLFQDLIGNGSAVFSMSQIYTAEKSSLMASCRADISRSIRFAIRKSPKVFALFIWRLLSRFAFLRTP